jgi:putative two-component system response regulator
MSSFVPKIMLIDDMPQNLKLLSSMLEGQGYEVFAFVSGELALKAASKNPPDLILLDIKMPGLDGYQVCQRFKADKKLEKIPVLFLSALADVDDKLKAFQVGGVDYITKPFQIEEINARVKTHLKIKELQADLEMHNEHLEELVTAQVKELSEAQMSIIFALAKLAEYRDLATGNHLERVQQFCSLLANQLRIASPYSGLIDTKFISNIYLASPLHDIGKVAIPDHILLKSGKLTTDEFEIMKTHTTVGAQYLEDVLKKYPKNSFIKMGVEMARSTHERWDGRGYPQGLAGESIPLCARIMNLVDAYDAMRSKRSYKEPMDHKTTTEIIASESGKQFDPVVTETFVKINEKFEKTYSNITQ